VKPPRATHLEKLLVCIKDITRVRELEQQSMQKQDLLERIDQIISYKGDITAVFRGFENILVSIERVIRGGDLAHLKKQIAVRYLHTLKGNARSVGFPDLADEVHELEGKVLSPPENTGEDPLVVLERELVHLNETYQKYVKAAQKINLLKKEQMVSIDAESIESLIYNLKENSNTEKNMLQLQLSQLVGSRLVQVLGSDIESVRVLASELGKPDLNVVVRDDNVVFKRGCTHMIRDIFGHLLRNSVCHGIESRDERLKASKNPSGEIVIDVTPENNLIKIVYSDDGRGLDLEKIKQKFVSDSKGKEASNSSQYLAEKIFGFEVSTADSLSANAGRGVGMGAVKGFVEELGGEITIHLKQEGGNFAPFELRMAFPKKLCYV